jgi:hypothetical protein
LISGLRSIGATDAANTEERRLERQAQQQGAPSRKRGAPHSQVPDPAQGEKQKGDGPEGGVKRAKIEPVDAKVDAKPAAMGVMKTTSEQYMLS